jgi:hypothetical protein
LLQILDENEFKICEGVDSARVRSFVKSIEWKIIDCLKLSMMIGWF